METNSPTPPQVLVMVTGASGMLGKYVTRTFAESLGIEVPIIAQSRSKLDITNHQSVQDSIDFYAAQATEENRKLVVVNCAAYTDVDGAEEEPESAFLVNSQGPANLASALRAHPNSFLLHISTDYVYNNPAGSEYTKIDIPKTVYGKSKLMGEIAVSSVPSTSLRVSWLYGSGRFTFPQLVAENYGYPDFKVVSNNKSRPTYCGTLAKNILRLCQHFQWFDGPLKCPRVINYTLSPKLYRDQFATAVLKELGVTRPLLEITTFNEYLAKRKAPVPQYTVMNSSWGKLGMSSHDLRTDLRMYLTELYGKDYQENWRKLRAATKRLTSD